jgi:hypothetical protein
VVVGKVVWKRPAILEESLIEKLCFEIDRYQQQNECSEAEAIIQIQVLLVKMIKNRKTKHLTIDWNKMCNGITYLYLRMLSFDRDRILHKKLKSSGLERELGACLVNLRFPNLSIQLDRSFFESSLIDNIFPDIWFEAWAFMNPPDENIPDCIIPF